MLHNFVPALACFIVFTSLPFDRRWLTQPVTLFQIQEWNTKKTCGICSKLTIETSESHRCFLRFSCQWGRFNAFVNSEQISHNALLALNRQIPAVYILICVFVCVYFVSIFTPAKISIFSFNALTPGVKKRSFILTQICI